MYSYIVSFHVIFSQTIDPMVTLGDEKIVCPKFSPTIFIIVPPAVGPS